MSEPTRYKNYDWTLPVAMGNKLVGKAIEFRKDSLGELQRMLTAHGPLFMMPVLNENYIVVNRPDGIHEMLVSRRDDWSRGQTVSVQHIRDLMGEGPLTADGATWKRLRKAIWPSFRPANVRDKESLITQAITDTLTDWEQFRGRKADLFTNMVGLTIRITFESLFSASIGYKESMKLANASLDGQSAIFFKLRNPWYLPEQFPTPNNRKLDKAMQTLEIALSQLVVAGYSRGADENALDLWSVLQHHQPKEGVPQLSQKEIRNQLYTVLLAAPENMAVTLSWMIYMLARHPEVESRLREEMEANIAGPVPTLTEVRKMGYLNRVIMEVMRLYPGAPWFDRRATQDTEICGHKIPKGSVGLISPYLLHRSTDHWEDPHTFNPDRFLDKQQVRNPGYIPWGLGPRRCVGEHFALIALQLALPMLLGSYRFQLKGDREIPVAPRLNLRPEGGMEMLFS